MVPKMPVMPPPVKMRMMIAVWMPIPRKISKVRPRITPAVATFVVVTHELQSIFAIGTNSIFLDGSVKNITGRGNPNDLLQNPPNADIYEFLTRGKNNDKTA